MKNAMGLLCGFLILVCGFSFFTSALSNTAFAFLVIITIVITAITAVINLNGKV